MSQMHKNLMPPAIAVINGRVNILGCVYLCKKILQTMKIISTKVKRKWKIINKQHQQKQQKCVKANKKQTVKHNI